MAPKASKASEAIKATNKCEVSGSATKGDARGGKRHKMGDEQRNEEGEEEIGKSSKDTKPSRAPCRERDLIDIRHLFQASENDIDSLFKTRTMDIGQAIDRTDIQLLSGYEALILQGIPVDEVSFTTESNRDLKDLASNAMTSTVVDAALLTIRKKEPVFPDQVLLRYSVPKPSHSLAFDSRALITEARNSVQQCYCEGSAFCFQV
ncbi:DNA repair protein rad5 [Venturia nashicola]|uniref:DNA repair protein rad5 n=1 Tax=Venturia nashicola TaxID=86259 RepID=A0A4Z1P0S4_9PEZI|nr:DNA repair protein rad5 [Venturia nashicola]